MKKHHYFIKFLFSVILFTAVTAYAYFFPVTMKLLDKNINKMLVFAKQDLVCTFFEDYSDFTKKNINVILYNVEIIINNIKNNYKENDKIPIVIFSCMANFPIENGFVTSDFGNRKDPFSGKDDVHSGIDIAAEEGKKVAAAWPGKIKETGFDEIYGNYIIIEHSKDFYTKYCHLSKICVTESEYVLAKEKIAEAGSTGRSTGSHLHFEVIVEDMKIDPMECFEI